MSKKKNIASRNKEDNFDENNRPSEEQLMNKRRTLKFDKLVLFALSSVAGDPYRFEDAVGAAGARRAFGIL